MKSLEEFVNQLNGFAELCADSDACRDCQTCGFCEIGWQPAIEAEKIERLAWLACSRCDICSSEAEKNPLNCEILGTDGDE